MNINLQRFCANSLDAREYLRAPWVVGEWVYATNGHIAIRVPVWEGGDVAAGIKGKHPDANRLFVRAFGLEGAFLEMPADLAKPDTCESCGGTGIHNTIKCPDCNDGEFKHGSFTYECQNCAGSPVGEGYLTTGDKDAPIKTCHVCDGLGQRRGKAVVGAVSFDIIYLNWIAELPNAHIKVSTTDDVAAIKFDGGQAILMPRRD